SLLDFSIKKFKLNKKVLLLLFSNYVIYSSIILPLSLFLIKEEEYFLGILISALLPPAVMAIPYVFLFEGEKETSLLAEFVGYCLTLLIIPLAFYIIQKQINFLFLLIQLSILMIIPFVASRLISHENLKKYNREIVNFCIFLINASVISYNRNNLLSLITFHPIWIIVICKVFFIPLIVYLLIKKVKKIERKFSISFTIFSSAKNSTLGIIMTINLFSPETSVPLVIFNLFGVFYPLFFEFLFRTLEKYFKFK
ncbi:MAG: hypothetical protein QXI58_05180, partial [Candidatus Micrarchaeia archaeon]